MRSNVYIFKIPFQLSFSSKFKMSFGIHIGSMEANCLKDTTQSECTEIAKQSKGNL